MWRQSTQRAALRIYSARKICIKSDVQLSHCWHQLRRCFPRKAARPSRSSGWLIKGTKLNTTFFSVASLFKTHLISSAGSHDLHTHTHTQNIQFHICTTLARNLAWGHYQQMWSKICATHRALMLKKLWRVFQQHARALPWSCTLLLPRCSDAEGRPAGLVEEFLLIYKFTPESGWPWPLHLDNICNLFQGEMCTNVCSWTIRCSIYAGGGKQLCFPARNHDIQSRGRDSLWDDLINSCCVGVDALYRIYLHFLSWRAATGPSRDARVGWFRFSLSLAVSNSHELIHLLSSTWDIWRSNFWDASRQPDNCSSASVPSTFSLFGLSFGFNFHHMIELWILGRMRFFSFRETLEKKTSGALVMAFLLVLQNTTIQRLQLIQNDVEKWRSEEEPFTDSGSALVFSPQKRLRHVPVLR